MFAIAYRRKLIADNPTAYVSNLKEKKAEVDPFEPDEVRRLLAAAVGWERAFLTVLVFGGLRPNEALALHWLDIDRQRNTLRVRRNLTRFGFGPPKTERSDRTIEMAEPLRAALQEQRARSDSPATWCFRAGPGRRLSLPTSVIATGRASCAVRGSRRVRSINVVTPSRA